jgi:hypothetical protein
MNPDKPNTLFYRIRYCGMDGREVPVYAATLYRVFAHEYNPNVIRHIQDFPYLSAANEWIKRQVQEAV